MSVEQSLMDVDTDLIALAMHKLSIDNTNVTDVLNDCNIYLYKLNRPSRIKAAILMDLNLVFDCLNTTNERQIQESCALLKKLLSILPPSYVFTKYSVSIERSLHHPNNLVKQSVLSELDKLLAVDNNVDLQMDIACTIVDCVPNSCITVSYNAVKCLKRFKSIETLSSPPLVSKLKNILEMNAKIRSHVYEILIDWAKSIDALALISSKGLFSNLVSDITSSDIMMQIVTIQMIVPLALSEHGFDYLNAVGVISGLYRLLSSRPKELPDPSVAILSPIVLEFFVKITQVKPNLIYTAYPKLFTVIYEVLKEGDDDIAVGVVINAINTLAGSWDCKFAFDKFTANVTCGYQGDKELDLWSMLIIELHRIATSSKINLKGKAIQTITKIIQIDDEGPSSKEHKMKCTEKWYKQLKDDPIKNIVYASCIMPFLEVRRAGYEMLLALAEQPWGQEEINKLPALLELVFKISSTEPIITRFTKKLIISTLLESDTAKDIFNEDIFSRMRNVEIQTDGNDEVLLDEV